MKSLRDAQYGDMFVYRDSNGDIALRVMFVRWEHDALGQRPMLMFVNRPDEHVNDVEVARAIMSLGLTEVAMWEPVDG